MTTTDYATYLTASFESFVAQRQESTAIMEARQRAFRLFEAQGLPTRKDEEWKYTNIHPYLKHNFEVRQQVAGENPDPHLLEAATIPGLEANRLVFVNGHFIAEASTILDKRLHITPIHSEEGNQSPLWHYAADHVKNQANDPFVWLNQAFVLDGMLMEVPDNTELQYPVYLIHLEQHGEGNTIDMARHVLKVGSNCKVQIMQNYLNESGNETNLANHLTQVFVGDNSDVEWYSLQYRLDDALHLSNFEVEIGRDGRFTHFILTTSGKLVRNVSYMKLAGQGSDARMYGLYQLSDKEHVDNRTLVDHALPHCTSDELYKGILDGHSTAVFNGKIIVRPDAQKTNAFQHNPNLVLSDDASIYSKPQLEIFADDVKCSHGATSGQLDDEALFYLKQRGLPEEDARGLLTYAFANEVIEKVNIEPLQQFLQQMVQGNLHIH